MAAMGFAEGGMYLGGPTDGMADQVPANIGGSEQARLSHGEYVVPADVVSHLGNGNSEAGADILTQMGEQVREARTGNKEQGKRINPAEFMPVEGGPMRKFDTGGYVDPMAGQQLGAESSLSNWAGPYVTDMLGKGAALSELPYTAYTGPLTAGQSGLQDTAFSGLGSLQIPTNTSYTPQSWTSTGVQESFMSPYIQGAIEPQLAEAQRQAQIQQLANSARMTKAGAYGGSRQALMDSETQRNLLRNMADITGRGYEQAYNTGMGQFNAEENRNLAATGQNQQYGLSALGAQLNAGAQQRGIQSEGIAADMGQFAQERDYPYKQLQFQQSLLQGLPVAAQSYSYAEPSNFTNAVGGATSIVTLLNSIFDSDS